MPSCGLRLALGLLALLYVVFVLAMLAATGIGAYVGIDFRTLWCSLRFAHAEGFGRLYDITVYAQFHEALNPTSPDYARCATPPIPYLPVFLAAFWPLAFLSPVPGFLLWTALNVALFLGYCYRFTTAIGTDHRPQMLFRYLLAYALYENLVAGQVNVLLLACFGESILAFLRRQELRSGAWLAGLLLKPQALLLVLPGLARGRYARTLFGFAAAGTAVVVISLALAGVDGLLGLGELIRLYSGGLPPTYPDAGMNWRALAIHLTPLTGDSIAWSVAILGGVLTAAAGLSVWFAPRNDSHDDRLVLGLLGSFAASSAITWHSHVYSALPLLAPLIYLTARGRLPAWLFQAWLILPGIAFFVATLGIHAAFRLSPKAGHSAAGLAMLAVNLAVVAWATWTLWGPARTRPPGDVTDKDAAREPSASESLARA
jgi:hypothetical protein